MGIERRVQRACDALVGAFPLRRVGGGHGDLLTIVRARRCEQSQDGAERSAPQQTGASCRAAVARRFRPSSRTTFTNKDTLGQRVFALRSSLEPIPAAVSRRAYVPSTRHSEHFRSLNKLETSLTLMASLRHASASRVRSVRLGSPSALLPALLYLPRCSARPCAISLYFLALEAPSQLGSMDREAANAAAVDSRFPGTVGRALEQDEFVIPSMICHCARCRDFQTCISHLDIGIQRVDILSDSLLVPSGTIESA